MKILTLGVAAFLLAGCAAKNLVYAPTAYEPKEPLPFTVKIAFFEDKTDDWEHLGGMLMPEGGHNLAKSGYNRWDLIELTPAKLAGYITQNFRAAKRFSSVVISSPATPAGRDEILLTGKILESVWDCPNGPFKNGPKCVFRFEYQMAASIAGGATWRNTFKKEYDSTSPTNAKGYWGGKLAQKNAFGALNEMIGGWVEGLYVYLQDPVRRELATKSPVQVCAAIGNAIDNAQWGRAYGLAVGLGDVGVLKKTCEKLGGAPAGGEEGRSLLIQGGALAKKKRYAEAVAKYDKIVAAHPGTKRAYFNRALVLAIDEKYSEAIAGMRCYLAMNPGAKGLRKAKDKIAAWEALGE